MKKQSIVLITVLFFILASLIFYIWQNPTQSRLSLPFASPTLPTTDTSTTTPVEDGDLPFSELEGFGSISGSISYPNEEVPNLKVCALNVTSNQETCTTTILKNSTYTTGTGYEIEVPVGIYHVYAELPDQTAKAFFTEYVVCGQVTECTSHLPIPVMVRPNQHITDADPQDWQTK